MPKRLIKRMLTAIALAFILCSANAQTTANKELPLSTTNLNTEKLQAEKTAPHSTEGENLNREEEVTDAANTEKLQAEKTTPHSTEGEKLNREEEVTDAANTEKLQAEKDAPKVKRERNFKYSVLGGPGYTPDFGFVLGGSLLSTFRTTPSDSTLLRSVLPLSFALTFGRKLGFNLMLYPQFYFKGDKFRLTGRYTVKNAADNYYGVGFQKNNQTERGGETTAYYLSQIQINPVASFRIKETPLFIGPMVDFVYEKMSHISSGVANDNHYIEQRGDTTGLITLSNTVGFVASYDTRDVPANPYRGLFFELRAGYAPKFLGSDHAFGQLSVDYRQFFKVGERRTLAWTVNTKNTFGDVPLGRMPMVGSPFDLRGYYLGQYRDKSTSLALVEYRHMLNNDGATKWKRLWRRLGFATWAGVGVMGKTIVDPDAVLPNFGAGLRIEVQPRMNFRLDVGYSTRERQTLFYFNMTEAF
ncbi:MAG: BamA/TamA family outer membrane protein [Phocaeicola sp.]